MRITLKRAYDIFPEEWHLQKNVKHGELPFFQKDVHNFFSRFQQENLDNDVMDLLEYCKSAKNENPNFQFDFTVDFENRLENIFWSLAYYFDLYQEYGDSTGFDTTYRVNSYDMPFGIFIGIDNHGRTILFGCALLRNETIATFCWLMKVLILYKTFVTLMGKSPKTIITDQDPWMTQAISRETSFTKHAFCIWHITEWPLLVSRFNLQENKHVRGLYRIKKSWVPAYLRDHFFGGMTTTGRCESINCFVKRFTTSRSCLTQLIKNVDLAVEDIGQTQLRHTMLDTYRGSSLRTLSPLEEQVYTRFAAFAFKKFQQEFKRATQYTVCEQDNLFFIVKHYKESDTQEHKVKWACDTITCSCKIFEFWDILCRHILLVFIHKDCFEIPMRYLPLRWYRDEFYVGVVAPAPNQRMINCKDMGNGIVDLDEDDFISHPPISKTKGRPKFRREIGGKEAAPKQTRSCSFCKKSGHNVTTCPDIENVNANTNPITTSKKRKFDAQVCGGLNPIFWVKQ
ncbi:hypothetical protein RND81_07G022500 [Saponaria officinalis]|uniref:Protein FAR1-RELATED SEQUENCE n=1 Tax=Saponaria officinalis TaxID=3572 RepID=A0AAW1JQ14_SAPOF